MKHFFQVEIDQKWHDIHLWNKLFEAYQKDKLDSYITSRFGDGQFVMRKICRLFDEYKRFMKINSRNYGLDPVMFDHYIFRFDVMSKTIVFEPGDEEMKRIVKTIEYGVPGKKQGRSVFSKLTKAFYIYHQENGSL